ncbi:MAG: GGDEF domain-containing protein [Pseudomonadota bacterium]
MNPFARDHLTLALEFGARLLFAVAVFAFFVAMPVDGWNGNLPLMVATLVGYLVAQSLLFARALYGRVLATSEGWWVPVAATLIDAAAIAGALASDPFELPPTLLLALVATLNGGLRQGLYGFLGAAAAVAVAVTAAFALRGWQVPVPVAHGIDYLLVFMALCLLYCALLAWRRSTLVAEAAQHADQDIETQLLNRRGFDNASQYLVPLQQRTQLPLVIMLASLDRRGAEPLTAKQRAAAVRQVGHVVRLRARRSDVVARLSDDEFVFMLFDTPPAGAETLARAMFELFDAWARANAPETRVTFGMIAMPEDPVAIDQLIARARSSVLRAQKHPSSPPVVTAPSL